MGGYGSGRPSYKQKAEHCRSLDIYKMKRLGCLDAGSSGSWYWSRDGEEVARIGYRCTGPSLVLDYRVRQCGEEWEAVTQTNKLATSDCNYGGKRHYVLCPGIVNGRQCGRRVGKLFSGGKYFLCRHCYRIAYSSQSEPQYDRHLRRANKLRQALGGEPGTAHWIAPKPKGMWWSTYNRKRFEIEWCENQASQLFLSRFGYLLSTEERDMYFG